MIWRAIRLDQSSFNRSTGILYCGKAMAEASRSHAGAKAEMRVGAEQRCATVPLGASSPRQFDEAFELPDAGGVPHFAEGFGFDLADAFADDLEGEMFSLVDLVNLSGKQLS
jgi:hypothetical protein